MLPYLFVCSFVLYFMAYLPYRTYAHSPSAHSCSHLYSKISLMSLIIDNVIINNIINNIVIVNHIIFIIDNR